MISSVVIALYTADPKADAGPSPDSCEHHFFVLSEKAVPTVQANMTSNKGENYLRPTTSKPLTVSDDITGEHSLVLLPKGRGSIEHLPPDTLRRSSRIKDRTVREQDTTTPKDPQTKDSEDPQDKEEDTDQEDDAELADIPLHLLKKYRQQFYDIHAWWAEKKLELGITGICHSARYSRKSGD